MCSPRTRLNTNTRRRVVACRGSVVNAGRGGNDDDDERTSPDPALNTDEVRDAAKQVGHITDMDAYLAAIEHKMDVLAEHPAHNVREDIRDIKLGPRGLFVTSRPQFFLSSLRSSFFQNDASISFCSRAQNRCCSFFYPDRLFTSLVR